MLQNKAHDNNVEISAVKTKIMAFHGEDHVHSKIFLFTGQFKKKVTLSHVYNEGRSGVAILQHGLPWWQWPETLSRINYKHTLRVFLTTVYHVIVGSLVTSL
jgi:hypothetical protein